MKTFGKYFHFFSDGKFLEFFGFLDFFRKIPSQKINVFRNFQNFRFFQIFEIFQIFRKFFEMKFSEMFQIFSFFEMDFLWISKIFDVLERGDAALYNKYNVYL